MATVLQLISFSIADLKLVANFFSDFEGTCLLLSQGDKDVANRSILGLFPFETVLTKGHVLSQYRFGKHQTIEIDNPWNALEQHFFSSLQLEPQAIAFGWFSYQMGFFADPACIQSSKTPSVEDAYWQRCALTLIFDHASGMLEIRIEKILKEWVDSAFWNWLERLQSIQDWENFLEKLREPPADAPIKQNERIFSVLNEKDSLERQENYLNKVSLAQDLIREGEIYQVNLSQLFILNSHEKPFTIFTTLAKKNPVPFAAYFKTKGVTIISCSPERFLRQKNGNLETRPIKGTIRRGKTEEEDLSLKEILQNSPKERSELLMITDLMRNDLGRVSEVGSVKTPHLWKCEAYTSIYHLVSVIQSVAKRHLSVIDIIRSCFPPGSITGCPKLRAMAAIDDLEDHVRGVYTGSIGYIEGSGDFDLSVAIRTLVLQEGQYHLQLGSGIVYDSIANDEYQETLVKGKSFFDLVRGEL